jgi:hypothetical protein
MPNFKPKANKKIKTNKRAQITLDNKHNEMMKKFKTIEIEELPKLYKTIIEIENKLKNERNFEKILDLKDKLKGLISLKNKKKLEKKKYLLDNSKYIFDYFEKKKVVATGESKTKILHSFFANKKTDKLIRKSNEIQKYLVNVDEKFLNIQNFVQKNDLCKHCSGEMVAIDYEGILVCKKCFISIPYLIEHEKPSYKEPPKEVCFYAYKRINHFREILAQFQAKETTQIPKIVLDEIKSQIKKERINLSQMTNKKAKNILKKLGYNKYYEHIPFIKDKLGIKPPIMHPELEERLCNLFLEIQKPYAKHCPDGRVNFLNYYYVLYKMCELLDEKQFLPFFPMLKDPVKRIEQDDIWKKICHELNWEFIPTI